MKWSVLVVLVVLVASTYAGFAGPYHHYYVPGFQHTYVPAPQLDDRFDENTLEPGQINLNERQTTKFTYLESSTVYCI